MLSAVRLARPVSFQGELGTGSRSRWAGRGSQLAIDGAHGSHGGQGRLQRPLAGRLPVGVGLQHLDRIVEQPILTAFEGLSLTGGGGNGADQSAKENSEESLGVSWANILQNAMILSSD